MVEPLAAALSLEVFLLKKLVIACKDVSQQSGGSSQHEANRRKHDVWHAILTTCVERRIKTSRADKDQVHDIACCYAQSPKLGPPMPTQVEGLLSKLLGRIQALGPQSSWW